MPTGSPTGLSAMPRVRRRSKSPGPVFRCVSVKACLFRSRAPIYRRNPAVRPFRCGGLYGFVREASWRSNAPYPGAALMLRLLSGVDAPQVLGSLSTHLRAGIGGLNGRALQAGDVLHNKDSGRFGSPVASSRDFAEHGFFRAARWSATPRPGYIRGNQAVRVTRGRQYDDFRAADLRRFFEDSYRVKPESDRMGYRLSGPRLELRTPREYLSEGVADGTVQVLKPTGSRSSSWPTGKRLAAIRKSRRSFPPICLKSRSCPRATRSASAKFPLTKRNSCTWNGNAACGGSKP